jgi:hypothetical protein
LPWFPCSFTRNGRWLRAAVGALGYLSVALLLRGGGSGGLLLQAGLVVLGAGLAVAFSPLGTQALVRVPPSEAADASRVLTTVIQLSQAVGVAVFGGVFLTLAARPGGAPTVSGHAVFATLAWIAVTLAGGALAAVPLARAVRAAGAKLRLSLDSTRLGAAAAAGSRGTHQYLHTSAHDRSNLPSLTRGSSRNGVGRPGRFAVAMAADARFPGQVSSAHAACVFGPRSAGHSGRPFGPLNGPGDCARCENHSCCLLRGGS